MGGILRNFDWDIAGAEREFKRAIELNPSLAEAHGSLGLLLMFKRETEAAISEAKRAIELDPLSGDTLGGAGTVYLYLGMNDDAIQQFSKALAFDPGNNYARNNLGLSLVQKGMLEKGIREIEKIKVDRGRAATMRSDLPYVYAKAGRIDDVRELLSEWLNEVETNHELAVAIASAYTSLGNRDKAIEWLERAYSDHVTALISANADFVFDSIRMDPRFQSLMRKLGFTLLT